MRHLRLKIMILSLALVGLVGASGIAFSVIYFDSYDYRIQTVSDEYNHQTLMQELKRTSIGADSVRFRLLGDCLLYTSPSPRD